MKIYNESKFSSEEIAFKTADVRIIANSSQFLLNKNEDIVFVIKENNGKVSEYIVSVSDIQDAIKNKSKFIIDRDEDMSKCIDKIHVSKSFIK